MSKAFIYGAGIGSKLFALIIVTYPEGNTCTCSNGTKTLKAKNTSGRWIFSVPSIGTWTVSVTNGTDTITKTVEITAEGQSEDVKMSFWDGALYDAGNQYTDITGGWKTIKGKVTFNEDSITISAAESSEAIVGTTNAIDLSGFTTLKVTVVVPADYRNLGGSIKLWNLDTNKAVSSVEYNKTLTDKTSVTTLDISAINEPCQVRMYATYLYPYNHTFNITKVIMEAAT